jgi:hypothetical protein
MRTVSKFVVRTVLKQPLNARANKQGFITLNITLNMDPLLPS